MENKEYKPIMATFYDPNNSFFKSSANDRYSYTVYSCCNCDNCDAYKRKCCALRNGLFYGFCPYGIMKRYEGVTKRARTGYKWLSDATEKYKDVKGVSLRPIQFTCRVNDYIFLNLNFLNNYENPIAKEIGIVNENLIPINNWNIELVMKLINYHPRALLGGEITDYQKKYIPKFIVSLKRYFPDMYKQVIEQKPELEAIVNNIDYTKKLAKVKTLLAGKVALNNIMSQIGYWDGEKITTDARAFFLSELGKDTEVIINPQDDSYVWVYDNDTVTDETEFKDE